MSNSITTDIRKCERCGGDHDNLTFALFERTTPPNSHWALCPTTHEPILMEVIDDSVKVKDLDLNDRFNTKMPDGSFSTTIFKKISKYRSMSQSGDLWDFDLDREIRIVEEEK